MTEDRKHAILFAPTLLCARKIIEIMDSDNPNFAKQYFVDRAIQEAEFIPEQIDKPLACATGSGEVILFRGEPRSSCDGIARRGPTAQPQAEEGCSALAFLLPQLLLPQLLLLG